jgi:formylglycine-generating enzyme required for sulfatase activity
MRGGSWHNLAYSERCAYRGINQPANSSNDLGFRCVRGP